MQADIAQVADIRHLFSAVINRFGNLDILVNNKGIARSALIAKVSDA